VYSPAEFEKIKGFATTQLGRRFIEQRFLNAMVKFQFRSGGRPPVEGAKVWIGRPPSEEAVAWNEIAKAANHLCKLLDSEAIKWMPGFGDMTLANVLYDAYMEISETGDLARPLSDFPGGMAGFDPSR